MTLSPSRRHALSLAAVAAAALLAACGKSEAPPPPSAASAAPPAAAASAPLKIAFAYVGPVGDGGLALAQA